MALTVNGSPQSVVLKILKKRIESEENLREISICYLYYWQ